MESTFQIDIQNRVDGAKGPLVAKQRPFFHRKTHHKSRGGCAACKKRRIKVGAKQFFNTYGLGGLGKD
jgi:hypothetical protein